MQIETMQTLLSEFFLSICQKQIGAIAICKYALVILHLMRYNVIRYRKEG